MRRASLGVVLGAMVGVAAVAAPLAAGGQAVPVPCSKVWVGHEVEMQEFMRTARIVRVEDVPLGVTKPKRAFFEPGGPIESAAWKPLRPGMRRGFMESYKAEIAAYELDKLLGLQMVPPYVERRIDGEYGALSLWVEHVRGWNIEQPVKGADPAAWNRQVVRMKMFDMLIGNIDLNQGNLLYDAEHHLILIDHSRAFTTLKDISKVGRVSRVDRDLWNRMLALDEAGLTTTLRRWISGGEIRAILARRDRMQEEIARAVAARGEPAVFLP